MNKEDNPLFRPLVIALSQNENYQKEVRASLGEIAHVHFALSPKAFHDLVGISGEAKLAVICQSEEMSDLDTMMVVRGTRLSLGIGTPILVVREKHSFSTPNGDGVYYIVMKELSTSAQELLTA